MYLLYIFFDVLFIKVFFLKKINFIEKEKEFLNLIIFLLYLF